MKFKIDADPTDGELGVVIPTGPTGNSSKTVTGNRLSELLLMPLLLGDLNKASDILKPE